MSKETPMIDFTQPFNFAAHLFALNEGGPARSPTSTTTAR